MSKISDFNLNNSLYTLWGCHIYNPQLINKIGIITVTVKMRLERFKSTFSKIFCKEEEQECEEKTCCGVLI